MRYKEELKYILSIFCVGTVITFGWVALIYGLAMLFIFLESIHTALVVIVGVPIFFLYAWGFSSMIGVVDKKAKKNDEEDER